MNQLIVPDIFKDSVIALFTRKHPGTDLNAISIMLKIKKEDIYMPVQEHTDTIHILHADRTPVTADAVITREQGVLLGIQVADCVPILMHERERGIVSVVHAGWRGTAHALLKKTIRLMMQEFMCRPENIRMAMGPSIKWCCYEVHSDVLKAVMNRTGKGDYYKKKENKHCLDLATANKIQALTLGVSEDNIWISDECTYCYPDKYYSYRYAKKTVGRQGGFIGNCSQA